MRDRNIFVTLLCDFFDMNSLQFFYEILIFQAELELLLLDEGTEPNHFSLKSIQAQEVKGRKRHKRKYKKKLIKEESIRDDDFEVILLL